MGLGVFLKRGTTVIHGFITLVVLCMFTVSAEEEVRNYTPEISGYASFEAGQIVNGYSTSTSGEVKRVWLETGYVGVRAEADVTDLFRVLVGLELQPLFSFKRSEGPGIDEFISARIPKTLIHIRHGEGLLTIGDPKHPVFQLESGFFPYKYNPDVRNLGEYLFRTFCYPSTIINTFDRPYADMVGFRAGNSLAFGPTVFHHDLVFHTSMPTSLMDFWPPLNWSLFWLADYLVPRIFTIGVGVQWLNLFSVGTTYSHVGIDPTRPDPNQMGGREYTFAGTKLMTRFSFDVKGLFPAVSLFSEEDLKLYGEAAILGLKSYPDTISDTLMNRGYNERSWRRPIMFGINLPAFKLLDVLNFEFEYLDSPYPNSYEYVYYKLQPLPKERIYGETLSKVKWSVYAKRSIGEHISVICQVARDHLIPYSKPNSNRFADKTDVLLRSEDWWWTGKVQFHF
jgi:hypothetical protein